MPGIYDEDGKIRCTASPGSGFVGAYAPDGSWYVTPSPGSGFVGSRAPDGSLYITDATGSTDIGYYAPDGSVRITTGTDRNGALWISGWTGTVEENYLLADDLTWVTLTRGSVATYWDENGVLQTVTGDTPRFDYDPATLAKRGLLREMAATNLALQSNNFATTWADDGSPITRSQNLVGPDGVTNSGWTLTDTSAADVGYYYQSVALSDATTYTYSVFVDKTSGATNYPCISVARVGAAFRAGVNIDTNNQTLTDWTSYTGATLLTFSSKIVDEADEWFRIALTFTTNAAANYLLIVVPANRTSLDAVGDAAASAQGAAGFYGVQLEAGDTATSYIPTTTGSVTRNADVLTAALYTTDAVTEYYRSVSDLTQDSRVIDPFSDVNSETDSVWIEKFVKGGAPAIPDSILLESGDYLLLESGDYLLLE